MPWHLSLLQIATTTTTEATQQQVDKALTTYDLIVKGGVVMYPIILLSIIALGIFVERLLYIRRNSRLDPTFLDQIKSKLYAGDVPGALKYCQLSSYPVARMIEKGIIRMGSTVRDIEAAIENTGRQEVYKMEKTLPILAAIAAIAPMFGFLGTVVGMINAFYAISLSDNISIGIIAEGIYQKMVTSASGLIVGVMAYILYTILSMMVDRSVHRMELVAVEFLDLLHKPVDQ